MNKKINEDLLQAFGEMVPKDLYDRIEQNIVPQERTFQMKKTLNFKSIQRVALGLAAALILVVGGIFGGFYYGEHFAIESLVDIDVNPGIELSLNKKDRVLKAEAINDDAKEILKDMDLKDTDLKVAVNAIIGSMVQKGFLDTKQGGNILISVQNDSTVKADQLRKQINNQVHSFLQPEEGEISILNQTIEQKSDAKAFASTHKISLGKAVFILNLAKKDSTLKAEELAKLSLLEITALIKQKKLDISDIVDFDADDSLWENIADEIEDTNEDLLEGEFEKEPSKPQSPAISPKPDASNPAENEPDNNPPYIGIEKAKSIALTHAGVSATEARFDGAELDREDGLSVYEIEFQVGYTEYSYEIRATDGKILHFEKEIDD